MKKLMATVLACLMLSCCLMGASAKTKSVSNSRTYYSWCGIKIFSIGVTGWYDSNGSRVTKFNNTTATPKCYYLWTSSNRASWWTSTTNTRQAQCYGQAKFCLGFTSDKFTFGLQQGYYGITATGKP